MRTLFIIPLVLMSLVSFPSWGLSMDDLVKREGIYYKKFTDVPFTGEVDEGLTKGSLENGKKEGAWIRFHPNGQLAFSGNYKNGRRHGSLIGYHENGSLKFKGEARGGRNVGPWIGFFANGQLQFKGEYNDGNKHGTWVVMTSNGILADAESGVFEDGWKISD